MPELKTSKEQVADAFLDEAARDAARTLVSKPHPRDYHGTLFESANGPRWDIATSLDRELYWRDLAHYWRSQVETPDDAKATYFRWGQALAQLTNGYKYPTEVCAIAREALGLSEKTTPAHPDPTGKTREPPHCPTCECGLSENGPRDSTCLCPKLPTDAIHPMCPTHGPWQGEPGG